MTDLVTILGPIGSGKSTLAELLAERVREAGLAVASVDVDDVLAMLSAPLEQFAESWERVRRAHGSLVGAWVRSGIDVVIAHGPIFTPAETEAFEAGLPVGTHAPDSVDGTLRRGPRSGISRPNAGISRDPQFLHSTYERFDRLLPDIPPCDWSFDTSTVTAAEIVTALETLLVEAVPTTSTYQPPAPDLHPKS